MAQTPEVLVDSVPLTSIATWGDLEIRDTLLGCWEASWAMPLNPWQRYPQVRDEKPVNIRIGAYPRFAGNLADIDWEDGRMVAVGACRQAEEAICFAADGSTTTSTLDVAIDQGIARGILPGWVRTESLSNVPFGSATDETDRPNYIGALADAWAISVNKRWWVDANRHVHAAAAVTTPSAMIINDSGVLGTSDAKKAGSVYGRYLPTGGGPAATVRYPPGPSKAPEVGVYWGNLGLIDSTTATGLCQGIWSKLQGLTGWTNGMTVSTGQLRTLGGQTMPLWAFRAGQMVRLLGVRDERGLSANTDVVIGESVWTPGEDRLQLNPVGMAARDIRTIVEAAGGVLL